MSDLNIRHKELRRIVEVAVELGWRYVTPGGNRTPILVATYPPGNNPERLVIPANLSSLNDRVLVSWGRKVYRYADPEKLAAYQAKLDAAEVAEFEKYKTTHVSEGVEAEAASPEVKVELKAPIEVERRDKKPIDPSDGPITLVEYGKRTYATKNNETEWQCPECGLWWPGWPNLRGHIKVHVNQTRSGEYKAALELIAETAMQSLGLDEADPKFLAEEKAAHALTSARLKVVEKELAEANKKLDTFNQLRALLK